MASRAKIAQKLHSDRDSEAPHIRGWWVAIGTAFFVVIGIGRSMFRHWGEPQNDSVAREQSRSREMSNPENLRGLAPGSYTRDMLPPPDEKMRTFLDQLKKDAPVVHRKLGERDAAKLVIKKGDLRLGDPAKEAIRVLDKGQAPIQLT